MTDGNESGSLAGAVGAPNDADQTTIRGAHGADDESVRAFLGLRERHGDVVVIVSPPRSVSTALSRVFWEQPRIGFYAHEPFEITYYRDAGLGDVVDLLDRPLDVRPVKRHPEAGPATGLLIKEMPYQVGPYFPLLVQLATAPIVFLLRDPRLNITSRINRKIQGGASPIFPLVETGWKLIEHQVAHCRESGTPYVLVDSTDFRNAPADVFDRLFTSLDLPFDPEMLVWNSAEHIDIDNLGGEHQHLYRKALRSTGIRPATEPLPTLDSFTEDNGLRDHVGRCLERYARLRDDPMRIRTSEEIEAEAGQTKSTEEAATGTSDADDE